MVKVFFEREGRIVEVTPGDTLLQAARRAGVEVHRGMEAEHRCWQNSDGLCVDCVVRVRLGGAGLSEPGPMERELSGDLRLACQARVFAHVAVTTLGPVKLLPDTAAPAWGVLSRVDAGVPVYAASPEVEQD